MANFKARLKSKSFFVYSTLIHIFLSVIIIITSYLFFVPNVYNFMVSNFSARNLGDKDIVLIVIDDKSVDKQRWPWKRELYAKIFDYLHDYAHTEIIGFDSIPSAPDYENPESDKRFFESIKRIDNFVVGFSPSTAEYEKTLAGYDNKFRDKFAIKVNDNRSYIPVSKYKSISYYPEAYFNSVKYAGSVNNTQNINGYLVQADQTVTVNNAVYPSLALRMYMFLNKADTLTLTDDNILVNATNLDIPAFSSANGMQTHIHFYKRFNNSEYSHPKYSAIDIIDSYDALKSGKTPIIDPAEFNNKIVLVGANARASALGLEDTVPTPMLQKHPGVDIQATILDNIINDEFITLPPFSWEITIIILLSILTFVLISRLSFFKSLSVLIAIGIAYFIFCIFGYINDMAFDVITPLLVQLITMIFAYSFRFILEGKNKEKIKQAMGKYLSQDIMQNVVKNIDDIRLGGKKANVTVLFADIRGFTSMSEKMTAEEVSMILNEYFSEIEPIITKYNGVINKFIGDAVMAIFGEPIQDINHPTDAVKCAYDMLKKVDWLQDKWLNEGKPKIEIGIGINTGEAFVGNIGSEKRLEYTVIGDMVNLASRIESYNKVYKTNFLISSSTYAQVSSIVDVIKISEVTIRGKSKKMDIYEVLRVSSND